jgi:rare lipoprotein A
MRRRSPALLAAAALLVEGCGGRHPVRVAPVGAAASEVGVASWYGEPYHGRRAASGELYDMEKLTAAHRTLPFGARVRVENLENARSTEVRINDRGPFARDRILDVSRAAARALGMLGAGTARVRLRVLSLPGPEASGTYAVQVGAFQDRANAERLRSSIERRHGSAILVAREGEPALWRVLVGRASTVDAASALARRIQQKEGGRPFVVRLD